MKKALALILTLCMLVGMPLCLEVAATGDPNTVPTQQTARLVQALALADGRVQLYFNCQITINPAPAAYIALVDGRGLCAQIDPVNGTRGSGPIVSLWDAVLGSDFTVSLVSPQTRNYHPACDTVSEILALAQKTGLNPVVRLRESVGTIQLDSTVYGLTVGTTGQGLLATPNGVDKGGCGNNGQVLLNVDPTRNGYDYVDVTITAANRAPSLSYVECNGTMIRPIFSEPMYWDGRAADANPTHLRVVNSKGQIMYTNGTNFSNQKTAGYYAIGNFGNAEDALGLYRNTFFTSGAISSVRSFNSIPYAETTRNWTSVYNDCVAKCNTLNRIRFGGESYKVALVIEENVNALDKENGDYANNFRIDGMWTASMVPLTATHSDAAGDRVVVPLRTSAEIERDAANDPDLLTLKSVSTSSTPGLPDRILVEFSKPVSTLRYQWAGIRLYAANGWVPTIDGAAAQWAVGHWEKYSADGKQWIGQLDTRYECNTVSQIENWLVSNNHAGRNGNTLTMKDGKRLEFAFVGTNGSVNDRMIAELQATDGTPLFANDSPFLTSGEDRAGIPLNQFTRLNSVNIEHATVYADKYVIIDFDQDVTWNLKTFYNGLCVYDKQKNNLTATNGTDYNVLGTSGYTTNLQRAFTSWTYYGNRKDVVVATLADGDYAWLADHLSKANTLSAGRYELRLRLQDKPAELTENTDKAVDGITALASPLSRLYTSASGTYSTVYATVTHHGEEAASAKFTGARLVAENKAILSFSAAVTAVDATHIHLVSGNHTYPIASAEIDGHYVTVTFDGDLLQDGMGIRIDGGADYRIPSSVITCANGAVVYADETASSTYVAAEVTEAVAEVKYNDTYYVSLSSVWKQQKKDDVFTLTKDVDMSNSMMVLSAGVTLDLNGHTLTLPYLFSFGHIVDQAGDGLLAMSDNGVDSSASLQADNRQLPLYDAESGGYRFFSYDIENLGHILSETDGIINAVKYGIRLHFDNPRAYTLLQDAENAAVTLTADLVMRFPDRSNSHLTYTFRQETLSRFASEFPKNPKRAITLTVNGFKNLSLAAMSQPSALIVDTYTTLRAACGVEHDSTNERTYIGITPAQAAVNWIRTRLSANDLVRFQYNGAIANLSTWSKTEGGDAITPDADWTHTVTYTKDSLALTLTISFNQEHAALDWVGNWKNNGSGYSKRISDIRILNAPFPVHGAVMTTARQGGQNYAFDYQPYSVDLKTTNTYSMQNTGGRSSQSAWPYFDLTANQNTYGIMGAIGWTGNWKCDFTYSNNTVTIAAGMQNTDYVMKGGETLRTPSMVIQFFKGTQDDGHNAWRQLILDEYTPDNVYTYGEDKIPCAPISINCWGGLGETKLIELMQSAQDKGQYFEYQWIDAGWYGDYVSANGETHQLEGMSAPDQIWHTQRGSWYYNPGYTTSDPNRGTGGFDKINAWHAQYQAATGRNTGLIVWFEPSTASAYSVMAKNGTTSLSNLWSGYTNPITNKTWKNDWFFSGTSLVDYGNSQALDYIKAIVLHYLDDMNADFYRQDVNNNFTAAWNKKDTNESTSSRPRTGVAEIQYVMGHYSLLDAVLANGYKIDNCASGGRLLDIEMMKRSIPLWRADYSGARSIASGIRSQGANLAWWLPISGATGSSEGLTTEYGFRSTMASGITMNVINDSAFAKKMIDELLTNREIMLGDYYILQQGLHESLKQGTCTATGLTQCWIENDPSKDYTNSTNAAYEFYLKEEGRGYVVAFRPTYSTVDRNTIRLKGLDRHADYLVCDADTGESGVYTGRYLMEQGLDLHFPDIRTSRMIYFTKQ